MHTYWKVQLASDSIRGAHVLHISLGYKARHSPNVSHSRVNSTCETNKHNINKVMQTKRMLKTQLQLPRNQGFSLNLRQWRHFDECKRVVGSFEMRGCRSTGIDGPDLSVVSNQVL